jgi:hypothetical protein
MCACQRYNHSALETEIHTALPNQHHTRRLGFGDPCMLAPVPVIATAIVLSALSEEWQWTGIWEQ